MDYAVMSGAANAAHFWELAQKDIDKIWTSFYRADKSLSRAQGRFGLGLSIVAAIQDLHGEDYGVNNLLTGVEFWFDIKKAEKSVL